ncbi:hypothetical protein OPKNFCMD_1799 [Methylobacterium crusticola]|uniref:Uncharacterized protein n=1 Tax=Methylobacterium crusticola TaxID=1697972 RepID=A0ABQ4QW33_9HYPH|nr:hypothetical protein [Methylobacterium crusticola]GJD49070.1 hypothetical protein OPKNFCMD_1799 [Methylobacterium crusticola]
MRRWLLRAFYLVFVISFNVALLWALGFIFPMAQFANPLTALHEEHFRRAIPKEIEAASLVAYGSTSRLWNLLFPIPARKSCGGAALRISDETAADLEAHGLVRLRSARIGQGYQGERLEDFYTYGPWRPTPVPNRWRGDGKWAGSLHCFGENDPAFDVNAVYEAAREAGGYFTEASASQLLLIPRLRLVVITFDK